MSFVWPPRLIHTANLVCCLPPPLPPHWTPPNGAFSPDRFCWAMIKIREEIDDIAEGRVAMEQRYDR